MPKKKTKQKKETVQEKKPVTEKGKWYIVHTYSSHEEKVKKTLEQRIGSMGLEDKVFEIVIPTRNVVTIKSGKKKNVSERLFPGYILVRMKVDDQSWLAVRTTPGITGFIGAGNQPLPISEKEVETIMKFSKLKAPKYKARFSIGEAVKITDGPFAEFLGTVDEIDTEKGKVKVLVSIFGRETPVELDFLQVSKL